MDFRAARDYVYHNFAQLSPFVLYGATFFLTLSLTCTWYVFCTLALSKAITSYSFQIEQLKKKKLAAEKKIKGKDTLAQQLAVLEAVLDSQDIHISKDITSQQDALSALLAQHKISVGDYSPETKEIYSRCASIRMTYSLNGSYENFINFFAALRELKPAPISKRCIMTRMPNGIACTLNLSCLIRNDA